MVGFRPLRGTPYPWSSTGAGVTWQVKSYCSGALPAVWLIHCVSACTPVGLLVHVLETNEGGLLSSLLFCSTLIVMEVKTRYKSPFSVNTKPFLQTWLSARLHNPVYDKHLFSGWDIPSLLARSHGLATEMDVIGTESKASKSFMQSCS